MPEGGTVMGKLKNYKPTRFMAKTSHYDKARADYVVSFIECLCHTKGRWAGKPFILMPWQERIIRDVFGIIKPDGHRQFSTAYIEIPKKNGKVNWRQPLHCICSLVTTRLPRRSTVRRQTVRRHLSLWMWLRRW